MAISFPLGENFTQIQLPVIAVHGSVYFVQNPALRGYTTIQGALICPIAILFPSGLKDAAFQKPTIGIDGSLYLVPNQLLRG
jgi:hypothetical protein